MTLLRTVLANRRVARLMAVWAAASTATWAFTIVLALYAYERGGTPAVGLAVMVRMLPSALMAPYAAMLADRHSRRAVLIASTLARAVALGAIGAVALAGAPLGVALVLASLFTVAGTAHKPGHAALLPALSRTPAELAAANVLWSSMDYVAFLVGSLLAGVLAGATGVEAAFVVCAVPMAAAALALLSLPADVRPASPGDEPDRLAGPAILEGYRTIGADSRLRLLLAVFAADMFVQSMVDVLLVVAAIELLGIGQQGVGWLNAAWAVGGVSGGVAAVVLLRCGRLAEGLLAGCVLAGVPFALIAVWPVPAAALALLLVVGVGYAVVEVALLTLTQRLAADDVLARVFGVQETTFVLATALGSVVAAGLVVALGAEAAIAIAGVTLPAVALTARRAIRRLEASAQVPDATFTRLRGVPLFTPLPMAAVETLAVRAETERLPSGSKVIEEGSEGHRFYVIEEGTVSVTCAGRHLRDEGPGEFFGEIALLRDSPRTATVTATTPLTLHVLDREDFLAGVGASGRSMRAASDTADERLAR